MGGTVLEGCGGQGGEESAEGRGHVAGRGDGDVSADEEAVKWEHDVEEGDGEEV